MAKGSWVINALKGELTLPGDKSISHRALMLLSVAKGSASVSNLSPGKDVLSTLNCLRALGVSIVPNGTNSYKVEGCFISPDMPLDCGNSGTTIRLLSGLLAGTGISATLTGDKSLQKRPMGRITEPLSQMGADIKSVEDNNCAPLQIKPAMLHPIHYRMPMASAQVKSAILLAGLFASPGEPLSIEEEIVSRDHTERMLSALGISINSKDGRIDLYGRQPDLKSQDIHVPGDISSAAFWMTGTAILPGSHIRLKEVGLNPFRSGFLNILNKIGTDVSIDNVSESAGEPYGDLSIKSSLLKGNIEITPTMVPALIDEIPVLTVLGLFTDGVFTLRGAEELRFKESDRLGALIEILERLYIDITQYEDGFSFHGNPNWHVPKLNEPLRTYHDHRLVMALEILNLRSTYPLPIEDKKWVEISYPTFFETLENLLTASPRLPE